MARWQRGRRGHGRRDGDGRRSGDSDGDSGDRRRDSNGYGSHNVDMTTTMGMQGTMAMVVMNGTMKMDGATVTRWQGTTRWLLNGLMDGEGRRKPNGDEPQAQRQ